MEPHDVLYCVEHEARELDIACAVRAIARERFGINIRLHFLTNALDPAVAGQGLRLIVVPSCTAREFAHKDVFQELPRVPILNAACEQLFSPGNRQYRLPRDRFARHHVLHVAAGDFFRNWLLEAGVPAEHIALTGSTTFQLYRSPYGRFYDARRETISAAHGLDPQLPWVLFPENFGAAFFKPSHIRKRIRGGYDQKELADYIEYSRKSFQKIAVWCNQAAAAGRVELIVRPRPAVSCEVFTDAFADACTRRRSKHLHFIKAGNVREWIFASQIVVSSYSTTLLEAAVAGKPAYLLAPFPVPESAASEWHEFAPRLHDQDALLELLHQPENARTPDRLTQWAESNLLNNGDAIENVARIISDICRGERTAPTAWKRPFVFAAADQFREGLRQTERCVRRTLRPRRVQNFVYESTDINLGEINERTERWAKLLRDAGQLRVA